MKTLEVSGEEGALCNTKQGTHSSSYQRRICASLLDLTAQKSRKMRAFLMLAVSANRPWDIIYRYILGTSHLYIYINGAGKQRNHITGPLQFCPPSSLRYSGYLNAQRRATNAARRQ